MDTGFHLPSFLKTKEMETTKTEEPELCKEARKLLEDFSCEMRTGKTYTDCSSLYEGAKNLYEEVHFHLTAGKVKVMNKEWTVDELDENLMDVMKKHEPVWERLLLAEKELRAKIDDDYKKVTEMEEKLKHARGYDDKNHHHTAWMFLPTLEQNAIRKTYHCKLKPEFESAKMDHELLCGYPDGYLTQISLLRKRATMEAADKIEKLRGIETAEGGFKNKLLHRLPGASLFA